MDNPTLFDETVNRLIEQSEDLAEQIKALPVDKQVEALNKIRQVLHNVSPFKGEPIDCVQWIKGDDVRPNDYNPNSVASPEMKLLEISIKHDRYTQPIVGYPLSQTISRLEAKGMSLEEIAEYLEEDPAVIQEFSDKLDGQVVVDGEHRSRVGKTKKKIKERIYGYLPVVSLHREEIHPNDRMAATIRHNRARGVHGVTPMANIVAALIRKGWTDEQVAIELGMDADEVLRYKQNLGLPELFKGQAYSQAWE